MIESKILKAREKELKKYYSLEEIAEKLGIGFLSLRNRRKDIMQKLGVTVEPITIMRKLYYPKSVINKVCKG